MLNGLSLFTGIGGLDVALSDWVRPIAYCEIDPYCQGVLLSRQATCDIGIAPIWDNVSTLSCGHFDVAIDIIYGGFPCQGISVAGLGKGLADERSGLFFEIVRLAKEIKPIFIFLENVPAITRRGGLEVVRILAEMGYDCRWCVISAASVGALHRRERWFLLAHAKHNGASTSENRGSVKEKHVSGIDEQKKDSRSTQRTSCLSTDVADTSSEGLEGQRQISFGNEKEKPITSSNCHPFESREHWQKTVSKMDKCSHGLPFHVDKIRALGNSVCPQQAKEAFKILMGLN
jgi:DNA (cytosine-5)-methyltransferase 1